MELTEDAQASAPDVAEHRAAVLGLDSAETDDELLVKVGIVKLSGVVELQTRGGGARSKLSNSRLHECEHV
jgi:hypothetical protein